MTNEQLQHFFNDTVFAWQARDLASEGIDAAAVSFTDNGDLLKLFLATPIGVLSLLDEECRFPGASDLSYVQKMRRNLADFDAFIAPAVGKGKGQDGFFFFRG